MICIKNCVVVLSVALLAACVTTVEPTANQVMASSTGQTTANKPNSRQPVDDDVVVLTERVALADDSSEDGYKIVCKVEEEVGSRIKHEVCRIEYPGGSALGVIDDIHKVDRMREMANSQRPKE